MDGARAIRTANGSSYPPSLRHDSAPVRGAVTTDLVSAQTVTAATKSAEIRAEDASHTSKIVLDAQSRELVNQALDAARQVVRQVPEEAKQRLRAYLNVRAKRAYRGKEPSKTDLDLEV